MTSSPAPDSTCYDCATNQTRLDTLDSEYVTLCEAIDALRTRLADLETRTTGLTTVLGGLALSSTVHHHSTRLHALEDQINRLIAFAASDQAHKDLARRVDELENTVRNLQRLAQSVHGPEAGL